MSRVNCLSRFLIGSKVRSALSTILLFSFIFFLLGYVFFALGLFVITLIIASLYILNNKIRKKNNEVRNVFSLNPSLPRNFDYLVIGDICNTKNLVPQESRAIYFLAPDRTLEASYLILKSVFSLLKENNGKVIFLINKRNVKSKKITLFDISTFHRVTIQHLALQSLFNKSRFPLIYSPIASIKILFEYKPKRKLSGEDIKYKELNDFCLERKISIDYLVFRS